jgi:hypothetical protein
MAPAACRAEFALMCVILRVAFLAGVGLRDFVVSDAGERESEDFTCGQGRRAHPKQAGADIVGQIDRRRVEVATTPARWPRADLKPRIERKNSLVR